MAEKTGEEKHECGVGMSEIMTDEQIKEWCDWFESRPSDIQKAIRKYPPGIYKLRLEDGSESTVTYQLIAYTEYEDGGEPTAVLHTEGLLGFWPRQVEGVKFEDLIPVDTLTLSNWISVKDRLPNANQGWVIVYGANWGNRWMVQRGFYDVETKEWLSRFIREDEEGYCALEAVTHWRPLPEPPKEEG